MKRLGEKSGLLAARQTVLFTEAALLASGRHERLARAVGQLLVKWSVAWQARRDAEDAITRANARVAWGDVRVDGAVTAFANELLRDVGGKSEDPLFRAFFPEAPSQVVRMGLEAEIARCEEFAVVASKRKLSPGAARALRALDDAMANGREALTARKAAYTQQAGAALDAHAWREAAEATRQSVYVQLQSWALENGEPRTYAEYFFPSSSSGRSSGAAEEEPTPTPAPPAG
jgi:hypothetical protein